MTDQKKPEKIADEDLDTAQGASGGGGGGKAAIPIITFQKYVDSVVSAEDEPKIRRFRKE